MAPTETKTISRPKSVEIKTGPRLYVSSKNNRREKVTSVILKSNLIRNQIAILFIKVSFKTYFFYITFYSFVSYFDTISKHTNNFASENYK